MGVDGGQECLISDVEFLIGEGIAHAKAAKPRQEYGVETRLRVNV